MATKRKQSNQPTRTQNQPGTCPKPGNYPPQRVNSPGSSQQKGEKRNAGMPKATADDHLTENQIIQGISHLDISINLELLLRLLMPCQTMLAYILNSTSTPLLPTTSM